MTHHCNIDVLGLVALAPNITHGLSSAQAGCGFHVNSQKLRLEPHRHRNGRLLLVFVDYICYWLTGINGLDGLVLLSQRCCVTFFVQTSQLLPAMPNPIAVLVGRYFFCTDASQNTSFFAQIVPSPIPLIDSPIPLQQCNILSLHRCQFPR